MTEAKPLHAHEVTPDDAAAIRMFAGAHFGPSATVTLPSGRTITGAEMALWVESQGAGTVKRQRWTVEDLTLGIIARIPVMPDEDIKRIGPGLIEVTLLNGQTFIITIAEDTRR